ncbi:MAG: CoA-acylating methylmalonate-semialdehyde dehydrogenase [Armatimonadota bacterium]|nr:CoA-acylating methylmalonate-semialdehyde dehydrogenase [Armatimonadota bacterium]
MVRTLMNYYGGEWVASESTEVGEVRNPATDEIIALVPFSTRAEVQTAIQQARAAFPAWRETPPIERVGYLFRLKNALEQHFEEISRIIVEEEGKTIGDARGEVRRMIENVEVACGIPSLMMGYNLEDVARGIDCVAERQPIGVFAIIGPFNFPAMVPWWFAPYAVATGNTCIIKPSEQVPCTQNRIFEIIHEIGFPPGVLNLINGAKEVVDALLEDLGVNGVCFVGSTPVAKYVYRKAAEYGKRVQALGGAKNFLVVMPDAVLEPTVSALTTSCFGAAGERCLSGSIILAVVDVYESLRDRFVEVASHIKVGYGLDETVQMGPLISRRHKERVLSYIQKGIEEGAKLILDGRSIQVEGYPTGYFLGPTIFDEVTPEMTIANEEIFGPVAGIIAVKDLEEALQIIRRNRYGNMACIFTQNGKWAREFKYRAECSMLGINVGIAAPMAFFTFGGIKESFFGDLKAHGRDAIEFFTDKKIVTIRWF